MWAVPRQGEVRFAAVGMGREDIADIVGLLRAALEPNATSIDEVPPFDVDLAYTLYRKLLEPARALTSTLFRRQAEQPELPRAEALRQAMVELIDRGGLDDGSGKLRFSYAHPQFWAPFSLIGDGG